MSVQEIVAQSRRQGRILAEQARWRMGGYVMGEGDLVKQLRPAFQTDDAVWAKLLAHSHEAGAGPRFMTPHERVTAVDWLGTHHPAVIDSTLRRADRICRGEVELFGQSFHLDFTDSRVWIRDPITKRTWPRRYWAAVNHRDGHKVGGAKWVWELNRHAHLVTLAQAFFLSNREEYAQEVRRQLISWIGTNSPYTGINWTSAAEVALRLVSWCWVTALLHNSRTFDPDLFRALNRAAYQQVEYILQHPSIHSAANHHRIAEAAGLVLAGVTFPWFIESDRWIETGRAILIREARKQIYPDGVGAEQSVACLQFVLEIYMGVAAVLEQHEMSFPPETIERLTRACLFLQALADDDGTLPDIGDRDDGRAFPLDEAGGPCPLPTLLNLAAVTLDRQDLLWPTDGFDEAVFWLTGNRTEPPKQQHPVPSESRSQAFTAGGYYILRGPDRSVATFDCGPLGYLSTAAHGHADALSITLRAYGTPLLIDPGTYAYHEAPAWRSYFRGTRAHNTVTVDGVDQSLIGGPFLWTKHAQAHCHHWVSTEEYDFVDGSHNGYESLDVTHRRRLLYLRPHQWVVVDDLKGHGAHQVRQAWHFPCEATARFRPPDSGRQVIDMEPEVPQELGPADRKALSISVEPDGHIRVGDVWLSISPIRLDRQIEARLTWGWLARIQGWVSHRYGHKTPAPVVLYTLRGQAPLRIATVLQVGRGPSPPDFADPADVFARALRIMEELAE
jgi:hypothetical protein